MLRADGWECEHLSELGMSRASDTDIVAYARDRDAAIVTLDADFHMLLAVSMAVRPSVIRLRLQNLDGYGVATRVGEVLRRFEDELKAGCLITVKVRKTTCRGLPTARLD